jgi:hypothetical protein
MVLVPIGLAACSNFPSGGPPVDDSTFSAVLVDLHLANARSTHLNARYPGMRDSVLARHGIERSEFTETLRYFTQRPDTFKSLYNGVLDTLNAVEGDVRKRDRSYENRPDDSRIKRGKRTSNGE